MAAELNVAVWATRHFNKSGGTKAIVRFLGSIGMVGISRAAFVVVEDEEDPGRILFLLAKINIGKKVPGLAFRIVDKATGDPTVPMFGAVEWEGPVTMTADEALAQKQDNRASDKKAVSYTHLTLPTILLV